MDGKGANNVVSQPDYETPEGLKAHALDIGSPMVYQAAEYIENYHALYAKALIELAALRDEVKKAKGQVQRLTEENHRLRKFTL